jgi:hypothetical protein
MEGIRQPVDRSTLPNDILPNEHFQEFSFKKRALVPIFWACFFVAT